NRREPGPPRIPGKSLPDPAALLRRLDFPGRIQSADGAALEAPLDPKVAKDFPLVGLLYPAKAQGPQRDFARAAGSARGLGRVGVKDRGNSGCPVDAVGVGDEAPDFFDGMAERVFEGERVRERAGFARGSHLSFMGSGE